ncbi:unnamed protein product, partial [Durusdinium trenchii]
VLWSSLLVRSDWAPLVLGSLHGAARQRSPMPLRASVQRWCGARVEAAEALRSFLVSKGAELDAQTLGPGIGTHGLGIFARRPIAKGEVLAAVPRSLVLEVPLAPTTPTVPTLRPSPLAGALPTGGRWYDVLGDGAGRAAARRLAERLLEEEEKGSKSLFAPYIHALPAPPQLHPLQQDWSAELVECSPMLKRLYEEAAHCHHLCLSASTRRAQHSSAQLSGALSLVLSRNFALQGSALGLLPFIDFFNHHRDDASTATAVSTRVPCTFQERWPGMVAMVAERSIYQGEELTFRYVAAPDSVLLVQYGIAPEGGNRHNLAGVEVFHDDVAKICREKWRVLQSWGWDGHTPLLFTVPDGLSSRAPLRRFAQLLASVDQEELAAATAVRRGRRSAQPATPPAAVQLLISWLLRARARMRLPDLVKDEKDCPLSAAVAAVVAGERDVLEDCLQQLEQELLLWVPWLSMALL